MRKNNSSSTDMNQPVCNHGWKAGVARATDGKNPVHTHIEVFVVACPTFLWAQIWNCAPVHARVNLTPVSPHWEETESWALAKASPLPLSALAVLIRLAESLLLLQTGSGGSQGRVSVPLRPVWGRVSWREVDDCCCRATDTLVRAFWSSWWFYFDGFLLF